MKIGLVGEAPLDTEAIKSLMLKKYSSFDFVELLKNKFTGSALENQKTKTELRIECMIHKPDIVIFIRDLDGLDSKEYREQKLKRQKYFNDFKGCTHTKKTIYLLNIWEIEALILSDIQSFNRYYKCTVDFKDDPMDIENPKEYLYYLNKDYSNSHNNKIIELSNFDEIKKNCKYFYNFINAFDKLL